MVADALCQDVCTHLEVTLNEHAPQRTRSLASGQLGAFLVNALVEAGDLLLRYSVSHGSRKRDEPHTIQYSIVSTFFPQSPRNPRRWCGRFGGGTYVLTSCSVSSSGPPWPRSSPFSWSSRSISCNCPASSSLVVVRDRYGLPAMGGPPFPSTAYPTVGPCFSTRSGSLPTTVSSALGRTTVPGCGFCVPSETGSLRWAVSDLCADWLFTSLWPRFSSFRVAFSSFRSAFNSAASSLPFALITLRMSFADAFSNFLHSLRRCL